MNEHPIANVFNKNSWKSVENITVKLRKGGKHFDLQMNQ